MKLSPLQIARYQYQPKLPGMLRNGISEICVKNGGATESVADQEKIQALFPNTYGKNEITFQKGQNTSAAKKQVVGVILSGGQAPGGHNVICGLYDALKATDKDNVLIGFKGGPAVFWRIAISYLMMNTSISTAIPAALILSVPAEPSWKLRSSSQWWLRSARSTV